MFFMSRTVWPLAAGILVAAMGWSQITLATPDNQTSLRVVADIGGESARPYYVAIGGAGVPEHEGIQVARTAPYSIEDMLPVVTNTLETSPGEALSTEPPLNPNQPNHNKKTPIVAIGMLWPGIAFITGPVYFPILGPSR